MNPVENPYAPGAGTPPPELAGRDELRESVRVAIERIRRGRPAKSVLMVGLRGVGKTVLLDRMRDNAEDTGVQTLRIEAPEGRSLPAMLAPQLRQALLRLSRQNKARDLAQRALKALAGFAKGLKLKYQDIEVGLDFDPEPGLADNGDLEHDLQALLEAVGHAAKAADTALVMFIDELQRLSDDDLTTFTAVMHKCGQKAVPIMLIATGPLHLQRRMSRAKSYAERLFDFPVVGPLDDAAARVALVKPAQARGVSYTEPALKEVVNQTRGYPYFLQEWGKHAWDCAAASPIALEDVRAALKSATAALDESFFRVRYDRLTPGEKNYLRAMAELGPGPHRSGDIAEVMQRAVTALAPTRGKLITKGMIWSPNHGDTAFTVPMFDDFMKRAMPGDDWR